MISLREIACILGGQICGRQVICPGPNHSAKDRSLSVTIGHAGKLIVHSFANDPWDVCRDYVHNRLGIRAGTPPRFLAPTSPPPGSWTRGSCLWEESRNPRGTLAETYLRARHLDLPDSDCVRFHPSCPFEKERHPALISLVRNIETNRPQGIQRTALSPDGTAIKRGGKTFRMMLGSQIGGAVKIDPDEDITQGLCIGEGLESTLSGRQLGYAPAWALLGSEGIKNFAVLAGVQVLRVFADNDAKGAGQRAARTCGERWAEADRTAIILTPDKIGADFNDVVRP